MKLTFLGSGTSQGVPVIACKCNTCLSEDSKDKRLRSSVLIEINNKNFVIDSGPDFRQQMLKYNVEKLDAILFTHEHKDHMGGLDDVRAYNYIQKKDMDVYCEQRVFDALKREYEYIFADFKYPGVPNVKINIIENKDFFIDDVKVTPIRVMHHKLPVFGFKIGGLVYITDTNFISEIELEKIKNCEILIINALRKQKHISHFNLKEALEVIKKVKPKEAYLTHISHLMGMHCEVEKELPKNVHFAYDGLMIEI
jgi:phosphoribosyl 1,2-cyclic phosphate phosphodiesterase